MCSSLVRACTDPETALYTLIYNAWGAEGAFVAAATTRDPTTGPGGWTRHGPVFPVHAKIDGWPGKSGSIVSGGSPLAVASAGAAAAA